MPIVLQILFECYSNTIQILELSDHGLARTNLHFKVLTKDSVTTTVDAVVFYRVQDAVDSVNNVLNVNYSTQLLAQTILRNVLGIKLLSEILSDREAIMHLMQVPIYNYIWLSVS